jgi:hypothetical protein
LQIIRANDGTYLLFSIGKSPLLTSDSLNGPWVSREFASCNNPAPVTVPGRDTVYVVCHGGPDPQHYGASLGLLYAPSWKGPWATMDNNTDDLLDGGRNLFAHPMEDPFIWWSDHDSMFKLLAHGFRMGMVNRTVGSGNGYGLYAQAPTPFGPWLVQEAAVAYDSTVLLQGGGTLELLRRERPKLVLDKDGQPTHLFNGVCPLSSHMSGPTDPGGHCFTLAQPAVPPALSKR